jgi:dihydrofolate reductase
VVDDKFKNEFFTKAVNDLANEGVKVTTENAQAIQDYIQKEYWIQNSTSIINAAIRQSLTKKTEEFHKEVHSDSQTNRTEAPADTKVVTPTLAESYRSGYRNNKK